MSSLTTVQKIKYGVRIVNGLGKPAPIDANSPPVAASSDETVASVTQPVDAGDGNWTFEVNGVLPGAARVTFTADADVGEGVNSIVGEDSVTVTADPRLEERRVELTAGAPEDVT